MQLEEVATQLDECVSRSGIACPLGTRYSCSIFHIDPAARCRYTKMLELKLAEAARR